MSRWLVDMRAMGMRDPRYAITGWRETQTDLKYNLLVINKICIYKGEKVSWHATYGRQNTSTLSLMEFPWFEINDLVGIPFYELI